MRINAIRIREIKERHSLNLYDYEGKIFLILCTQIEEEKLGKIEKKDFVRC